MNRINPLIQVNPQMTEKVEPASKDPVTPFSEILKNALNQVETDIKTSNDLVKKVSTGDIQDLHQVMIATEKANLGLQLTVQVRNKIVEAYQEIMRMQV
ncbi:flagellar hook-basal body complex protein FliE [Tepidibacillus fermentans]|uniref:flagellar hook-basal body complex protein FliE n=1 Tax=Tepidibacillus fermentans TaxID=1281767 RepID=UPI00104B0481|nr:flagellar hook-basal body complex protein FliE [Tepidibacillus fermentans]